MSDKYILEGKSVRPVDSLKEWAEWFEKSDRKVERTTVGEADVSTVFLGLDHSFGDGPPVLFETMIFGGEHDQDQWRYCTKQEAIEGHNRIVKQLKEGQRPAL